MAAFKPMLQRLKKVTQWLFGLIFTLVLVSAIYNLTLPNQSKDSSKLAIEQQALISETNNLLSLVDEEVWPGFADTSIPIIVYNEKYAFLLGLSNPEKGWKKVPTLQNRGNEWEIDSQDISDRIYYKQPLTVPGVTPENFTVKVGERWVATIQIREYAEVAFFQGFRKELPPIIRWIFPYRIFWNILMGAPEKYIAVTVHEMFHAYQGIHAQEKLLNAEKSATLEDQYPWRDNDIKDGWVKEMDILIQASKTNNTAFVKKMAASFIKTRKERRKKSNLEHKFILYEQQREWVEGLAKYTEIVSGFKASQNTYQPDRAVIFISGFDNYSCMKSFFKNQLKEAERATNHYDDNRFYFSGMLQALLLDKIMPDWKSKILNPEIYLDELIERSLQN